MDHLRTPKCPSQSFSQRTVLAVALSRLVVGAMVAVPGVSIPLAAYAQAETRSYNIPGGALGDVLGRFGRESNILLSFKPEITAGMSSGGLKGNHSVGTGLNTLLANTGISAARQANGNYVLNRVPVAQSAGGVAVLPSVTVTAANQFALPEVYAGGQVARGGGLGVLGTTDIMDTPFSTMNYTAEALDDLQARTLADVVVNEASVRTLTSSGGFGEDFQIRGYSLSSGDVGLNGLYGLTSSSRMPAAIMDRVEVLKGPGTLMNGISPSGSIGGGINVVTKRARDEPLTRLTTSYQSKSQFGSHLDLGRRFGDNNEWGIRVNALYRDGETGITKSDQQQVLGAVGIDYRGARTRWSLDAYTQHEDLDNLRPQIGFAGGVTSLPSPPSGHTNFFPGTELKLQDSVVASRLEYDVNDNITVYGGAGYRYGSADQVFPGGRANALGQFTAVNAVYDSYSKTKTADVGARARFDTFGVGHTLTLGATILQQEAGNFYGSATTGVASDIYDPADLLPYTGPRTSPNKASETTLSSFSLTDTLSFANDRLLITGGLRQQRVRLDNFDTTSGARTASYDEDAISPLAGIVIKPWSNVSVYGNFTSGLSRGGVAPATAANAGQVFPPYKSKQYEAGVKVDWDKVITSVSVFQLKRPNSITDPDTNIYSFDGEQRNRGLELAIYGEVVRGLRLMASGTFYDAKLTSTQNGLNDGNRANGVPKRNFNLGVDWDTPWIAGLSFNARMIYSSSIYFNAANSISIPSWTRYDVGARYRTKIAGHSVVFRANVENVTNKNNWLASGSYVSVAAPRTVLLSAQIDF